MHEGEGSAWEVCKDIVQDIKIMCMKERVGYPGEMQCRIKGHDPSVSRATPSMFPEPLPFCHEYGCVSLFVK